MNVNTLLDKLGFDKYAMNGKKVYSFDDVTNSTVKKELQLIQNVQLYNDFFAEEQFIASYRGQLSNLVNSSKAKTLLGYDTAYQHAVGALKSCIRNYKLETYTKNKPLTYITTNVKFELDKLYKAETLQKTIKMSSDLNQHKNTLERAKSILYPRLGREATNQELLDFIKNEMKLGSGLDIKKIERINHYETKELSGSSTIGQNNASGAEALTFEDVVSHTESIDDILNNESKEREVKDAILQFSKNNNETNFLLNYFGISPFKFSPFKGQSSKLRAQYNMTFYQSNKIIDDFRKFCKEKNII